MDDRVSTLIAPLGLLVIYCIYKKWFKKESEDHSWHEGVYIVRGRADCRTIVKRLKSDSRNIRLLGLDCQWEKANGCRKTIRSIMLSTFNGLIVVFRLDLIDAISYLKDILEDKSIIKIGVETQCQALYLFNDFDVRVASTFDLRYMAKTAGYFEPMNLKMMKRHYMQITSQINPYYPFENVYDEQILSVNARATILLFRLFCDRSYRTQQSYVVNDIIEKWCRPHLNFFYSKYYREEIHFKRLETVKIRCGPVYKLLKKNECTYCHVSDRYETYFPYIFELLDDKVLVLCEPCHRKSGHSSWHAKVNLIIPLGANYTTLNLNNVPLLTIAQCAEIVVDPQQLVYVVIDDIDDCEYWLKDLKRHSNEIPALSLDCEWVPSPNRRPIALLQLATCQGLCLLIRLCHIKRIPKALKEILNNKSILKVGVDVYQDAKYLFDDYHVAVTNTLDLRFMAEVAYCEPGGLATMASKYVLSLKKDSYQIHKNWESPVLTERQIKYATDDVFAGMLLFKYFAYKIQQSIVMDDETCMKIDYFCKKYIDQKYKMQSKKMPK